MNKLVMRVAVLGGLISSVLLLFFPVAWLKALCVASWAVLGVDSFLFFRNPQAQGEARKTFEKDMAAGKPVFTVSFIVLFFAVFGAAVAVSLLVGAVAQ